MSLNTQNKTVISYVILFESILQKINAQQSDNSVSETKTTKHEQPQKTQTTEDPKIIIQNIDNAIEQLNRHEQYTVLYKILKYCIAHMNYTDSEMTSQMINNDKLVLMLKLVLNKT